MKNNINSPLIKNLNRKNVEECRYSLYAVLSVFIVWMFVFHNMGIVPFGPDQFILNDNQHQYLPFSESFRQLLHGNGNLFLSWNMGSGYDFFANFTYYLTSPLNLLLIFVPNGGTATFLTYSIVLKTGLMALTFSIFIKKRFNINDWSITVFSVIYALCGFSTIYTWNTIWFDSLWLFPLLILSLFRLIDKQKCGLYLVALSLTIMSNIYIGLIICLFIGAVFILANPWKSEYWKRNLINFVITSLLAALINACMLIPMFIIQATQVSQDLTKNIWGLLGSFRDVISHFFLLDKPEYSTMEYSYAPSYVTIFVIWLFPQFFAIKKISLKEKILTGIIAGILIIGTNVGFLNIIFHGLHMPVGIPNRFSFITSFILIVCAIRTFSNLKDTTINDRCYLSLISSAFMALLITFSSMPFTVKVINIVLIMLYTGLYVIGLNRVLLILLSLEIGLSSFALLRGQIPDYLSYLDEAVEVAKMEDLKPYEQSAFEYNKMTNFNVYAGIRSYDGFSSMLNPLYPNLLTLGGGSDKNRQLNGMNPLISSLFGVKYASDILTKGLEPNVWEEVYYKKENRQTIQLYKNTQNVSMIHVYPENAKDFKWNNISPFENINELNKLFTNSDKSIYEPIELGIKPSNKYDFETPEYTQNVYISYATFLKPTIYAMFPKTSAYDYRVFGDIKKIKDENIDMLSYDFRYITSAYMWRREMGYVDFNKFANKLQYPLATTIVSVCNDTKTIFEINNTDEMMYSPMAWAEYNPEEEINLTEKINSYNVYDITYNGNKVTIKNNGQSGVLTLSTLYSPGWSVKVDGKKVPTQKSLDILLGVDVNSDSQIIEFTYISPGFVPGIIISVFALTLSIFLFKKKVLV